MRKGHDSDKDIYFRSSDRFVRVDGKYWFSTRDGDEGPFQTRELAEQALRRYIDTLEMVEKHKEKVAVTRTKTERGDPKIWDQHIDSIP